MPGFVKIDIRSKNHKIRIIEQCESKFLQMDTGRNNELKIGKLKQKHKSVKIIQTHLSIQYDCDFFQRTKFGEFFFKFTFCCVQA